MPACGPVAAGELTLPDGSAADVEPLHDCFVVWQRRAGATAPHGAIRLELLGRHPRLHRPGETVPLSNRHAELLFALLLARRGLTGEELAAEVYPEGAKPVTVRAEMSRLRAAFEGILEARPYRLAVPVTCDFLEAGPGSGERLLPGSLAPCVVAARERLRASRPLRVSASITRSARSSRLRTRTSEPSSVARTSRTVSIRSATVGTWLISPIRRPAFARSSRAPRAVSRIVASSVPKPSSRNSARRSPPLRSATSTRPSASASEAMNVSPPESVSGERGSPDSRSRIRKSSVNA